MRLTFSRHVESDLDAIAEWIAENNPERAITFLREIRDYLRRIALHPRTYRLRPEIGDQARVAVKGDYVVLFRIGDRAVRIERVVYGGRDLAALLQE